jgi:hypothetical protein
LIERPVWEAAMAYAIDHPIRRRQNPPTNVVLPKYDVKIVAGKRIVIFHPEEPQVKKVTPETEKKEEEPEPGTIFTTLYFLHSL